MCECGVTGSMVTDWASGDVVCTACGVVAEGHILDEAPEWHNHHQDRGSGAQDRSRVGGPCVRGRLAGTFLDMGGQGAKKRRRVARAEPRETALRDGLGCVDRFVSSFRLSTNSAIALTARELFEDAHEVRPTRSDTRHAVAAAAVYFACKMENTGRELRQVAEVCQVDGHALNAATDDLKQLLRGRPYHARLYSTLEAGRLLDIFLDRLRLEPDARKRVWRAAQGIDGQLRGAMDCGRKPRTICSGILFAALQEEAVGVSKKEFTAACGVCQQTLDKVVEQIKAVLRPGVPPEKKLTRDLRCLHRPVGA